MESRYFADDTGAWSWNVSKDGFVLGFFWFISKLFSNGFQCFACEIKSSYMYLHVNVCLNVFIKNVLLYNKVVKFQIANLEYH